MVRFTSFGAVIKVSAKAYEQFVEEANPDWYPIAFDVIPTPDMSKARQRQCFNHTMNRNRAYSHDGFVPVIHISRMLNEYVEAVVANRKLEQRIE